MGTASRVVSGKGSVSPATLEKVRAVDVPRPSAVNPNIPKALENIKLREENVHLRKELGRVFVRYLIKGLPWGNPFDGSVKQRFAFACERLPDEERARLRDILKSVAPKTGGMIVRTAAEGADAAALEADVAFLLRLWKAISDKAASSKAATLVHGDLPLSMRILRDLLGTDVERVRIDSAEECRRVKQFAQLFVPQAAPLIELYEGAAPIFDLYGVEDDINRALSRRVELKSGGHLVIDQTEAMTTIDVNTGGFVGVRNFDDTIFKTNLEAAVTIARAHRSVLVLEAASTIGGGARSAAGTGCAIDARAAGQGLVRLPFLVFRHRLPRRTAQRDVRRVHRHAVDDGRQGHATRLRRVRGRVRHPPGGGRRRDGADLLRAADRQADDRRGRREVGGGEDRRVRETGDQDGSDEPPVGQEPLVVLGAAKLGATRLIDSLEF